MKQIIIGVATFAMLTASVYAQSLQSAIDFNQSLPGSTARSLGMGGAFGALGGDPSCLMVNPAGLAIFRKSEFSFTPTFNYRGNSSTYLLNNVTDNRFSFNMGNAAAIFSGYRENRKDWKGLNFGIAYNRDYSFSTNNYFEGFNAKNSILNSYLDKANGTSDSLFSDLNFAFDVGLAYNAFLLNPDTGLTNMYTIAAPNGGVQQSMTQELRGGKGAWSFAFSNNYQDKIMLGGSLDISSFRYDETNTYTESDKYDSIVSPYDKMDFKSFTLNQDKQTRGSGVSAKFGIIVKPVEWLRVGAAFHTPVVYNMKYNDQYSIASSFASKQYAPDAIESTFDYKYTSPLKAVGSLALVWKQVGLLSVDYEYVDHQATRFKSKGYNFVNENSAISKQLQGASNVRVGAEYRYQIFAVRAGAAMYGSPVRSGNLKGAADYAAVTYTGGVGMRESGYYFDIGYGYTKNSKTTAPYTVAEQTTNDVVTDYKLHRIQFTLGFKF